MGCSYAVNQIIFYLILNILLRSNTTVKYTKSVDLVTFCEPDAGLEDLLYFQGEKGCGDIILLCTVTASDKNFSPGGIF